MKPHVRIMKGFFFAVKESVWLCSSVVEVPQLVLGKYGLKSRRSLNFFSGLFSVSCLNCGSYFRLVFKKFQKFISWKNHENGLVINCLQYVKSVKTCSQVPKHSHNGLCDVVFKRLFEKLLDILLVFLLPSIVHRLGEAGEEARI